MSAHDKSSFTQHQEESQEEDLELPLFDLATICAATDQFSLGNKIGQGGFGPVYKVWFILSASEQLKAKYKNYHNTALIFGGRRVTYLTELK